MSLFSGGLLNFIFNRGRSTQGTQANQGQGYDFSLWNDWDTNENKNQPGVANNYGFNTQMTSRYPNIAFGYGNQNMNLLDMLSRINRSRYGGFGGGY